MSDGMTATLSKERKKPHDYSEMEETIASIQYAIIRLKQEVERMKRSK